MTRFVVENIERSKGTCYGEIGLCAPNTDVIGRAYVILPRNKILFALTYYNLNLEFET